MRIDTSQWVNARTIVKLLNTIGKARFVGGCIRDSLLDKKVNDIDIATTLLPVKVIDILTKHSVKTIATGIKHGTVTAVFDKQGYEITTLRRDVLCDGRHAEVSFTTQWYDDAKRRDFTFNALYVDLHGLVYDYFNGIDDLNTRMIRFVGDPAKRICEDYLRILRAFRFYTAIRGKYFSEELLFTIHKHVHLLDNLAGERIQKEMYTLLSYENCYDALSLMSKCAVLKQLFLPQVDVKILSCAIYTNALTRLALLLRTTKNKADLAQALCKRWRFSKKDTQRIIRLTLFDECEFLEEKYKFYLNELGKELYCQLLHILYIEQELDYTKLNKTLQLVQSYTIPSFPIKGRDLLKLGYTSGKELGDTLCFLQKYWQNSNYKLSKKELLCLLDKK